MKKLIVIAGLMISLAFCAPLASQDDSDIGFTQDYITAMTKKPGSERIQAFEAYVKKYSDTTQKFTRLAYYWIAMDSFQMQDYAKAVEIGKKCLGFSGYDKGEEARLNLMLGNSYGVKKASVYDKDLALKHTNAAISIASSNQGLGDVLSAAKDLKSKLTTPPPPSETPEQKMKRLVLQDEDFSAAIEAYNGMSGSDKGNVDIRRLYGTALMRSGRHQEAVNVFKEMLAETPSATVAYRLGQAYAEMSTKSRNAFDPSVRYLIEAALRFDAEDNDANEKIAMAKAEHQLFSKYNYFRKLDQYNAKIQRQQASASRNEEEIMRLKREEFKQKRHIRQNYTSIDLAPPQYELDKLADIQKKLRMAQSGGTSDTAAEMEALKQEENRIKAEFRKLVSDVKSELEL
ncbi:MAG: tetratricopeptide repeat protein [Acidobacteriota bacterium]|jgi:tetratricopeptide (TPR) repeat protein|nr:tetratricopeptide repeat protein [Acidobacteriota bacterium]